jgi:hypothetical protein
MKINKNCLFPQPGGIVHITNNKYIHILKHKDFSIQDFTTLPLGRTYVQYTDATFFF